MLSVVLTVWNEETNLPRVLQSVKNIADEIVVVDTGSTDRTVEIAKSFGCRIFRHKNTVVVEPVRNFSVGKARGDWVLLLDADEEVTPEMAQAVRQAVAAAGVDYYRLPRKNLIFGSWIKSDHWWPDYVYRLFRKGYVVWSDAIHSIPETRGIGRDFPADVGTALVHHNYSTISQYLERLNRYTDVQLQDLVDRQVPFSWSLMITKPSAEFLNQYFARNGYREGIHGLVLAGLQAFSELTLYAKYWQYLGFKPADVPLKSFAGTVRQKSGEYQWWIYEKKLAGGSILTRPWLRLARQISVFVARHL